MDPLTSSLLPHLFVAAADTMAESGMSPPKQAPRPPVPGQQSKRGFALRVLAGRLLGGVWVFFHPVPSAPKFFLGA